MKKAFILLFSFLGSSLFLIAFPLPEKPNDPPFSPVQHVWTGVFSNSWDHPGNWKPASVPGSNDDVVIQVGTFHDPLLNKDQSVICRNAVIQACADKLLSPSGKGFTLSGGEVIIDGNLTIKATATLTINPDGALTVNGNLTILPGGNLVIESGGSLITNGLVTGIAKIKRTVPVGLGWHFLSSPVNYQEFLNGVFAPLPSNFSSTPSTCFDFYKFNSACDPLQWINLRSSEHTPNYKDFGLNPHFEVSHGYLVAYGSCLPKEKLFTGTPNTGDQVVSLSLGYSSCTWDLLGNPYPSAFKWSDVLNKSNLVSGYYYVWNEERSGGPGYEAYLDEYHHTPGVNGNIPANQGFFVRVFGTSGSTLIFPNSSRVHDDNYWLKRSEEPTPESVTIAISGNGFSDAAYLLFESEGSNNPDDWYDAEKMITLNPVTPQIFSIGNNDEKFLINSLPSISTPTTIPIGVTVPSSGEYILSLNSLERQESISGIILEDLITGNSQNFLQDPIYPFSSESSEIGPRFLLHFLGRAKEAYVNDENPISIFSYGNSIYISCPTGMQNGRISISNMIGQNIFADNLKNQSLNEVRLNAGCGYYIVKVQNDSFVKTAKIYIK